MSRTQQHRASPNVLYVDIEGIGFGAIDAFGGLIAAPNVARLADRGLRYTNFHTTALPASTRACLLTGRHHQSTTATIAAMLNHSGYASYAVGKCVAKSSGEKGRAEPRGRCPAALWMGFDRHYCRAGDALDGHWSPSLFNDPVLIDQRRIPRHDDHHQACDLAEKAIETISTHGSIVPGKPWLCYLTFGAGQAAPGVSKLQRAGSDGEFGMGWDRYRQRVLLRQKRMALVPPGTELAPARAVPSWNDLTADERALSAHLMEAHAASISDIDAQIARLVDFIEHEGELDNTLIFVFASDNGVAGDRTNGWTLAMNTPFELCRPYAQFASTRSPLIVHWPRMIRAAGETRAQFHHATDIVPTILRAIGLAAPDPLEGVSMNDSFEASDPPAMSTTRSAVREV